MVDIAIATVARRLIVTVVSILYAVAQLPLPLLCDERAEESTADTWMDRLRE